MSMDQTGKPVLPKSDNSCPLRNKHVLTEYPKHECIQSQTHYLPTLPFSLLSFLASDTEAQGLSMSNTELSDPCPFPSPLLCAYFLPLLVVHCSDTLCAHTCTCNFNLCTPFLLFQFLSCCLTDGGS